MWDKRVLAGITLRHFLTYTHGLRTDANGHLYNHFQAGQGWDYRDENIKMLAEIVYRTTGKTVAQISSEQIFTPMGFTKSGWKNKPHPDMVLTILDPNKEPSFELRDTVNGDRPNMFSTARELAYWGYLHLKRGKIKNKQIIPEKIFQLATTLQSPALSNADFPRNGFLWQVQDQPVKQSEIGPKVPTGSFQIIGICNQTILVIPKYHIVAIRLMNRLGNPPGYDYLEDIRSFGDCVASCI